MEENQKIIVADFLSFLVGKVGDLIEKKELFQIIDKGNFESGLFSTKTTLRKDIPLLDDKKLLKEKSAILASVITRTLGAGATEKLIEEIYSQLERRYTPTLANQAILPLVPGGMLDKYRLSILTKEELQQMVLEKTKANDELRDLDKRKTEFLSVVAHQLRTPLSGFKWGLDLMQKESFGPVTPQQKEFSVTAYKETEHMIKLVEDMLTANKIEFSAYKLKLGMNNLSEVIEQAIKEAEELAVEKSITITFKKPETPLPPFMFDKERIYDVFENLLDNAVKYGRPQGKVEVEASFAGDTINCMIKDDGVGIPAVQQKELFTRFFRAPNARAIDPNGNGLGLYIAKNMLEMHGGDIRFESMEDRGTTFFITFKINNNQIPK